MDDEEREVDDVERGDGEEEGLESRREWSEGERSETAPIFVDVGRGEPQEVAAGSPFIPTLEGLAERAHYGGYYRVFLNGREVINPEDSPETIEQGMRVAITSYDKVG